MNTPFSRAPHQGPTGAVQGTALNAALLIDFDNVTMGMRSDLSKDLQKLLQSDIIRGKVTVQRAYADWRRYPQYIVSLSENSIDLIFAPAYGSSKKNATDIRMAIDGMELVFTRPEIGTFILLTGDSDFSSLVLKLKEYGKYVIGVGIQESSSDILVQNCDEYYSYTSLTGLQKTDETDQKPADPWVLIDRAVRCMAERGDVMRSDRLKQVMVELDPTFNEGNFGFSKFSRFLTEAASRRTVQLKKLENGQYEVAPKDGAKPTGAKAAGGARAAGQRARGRRGERGREQRAPRARPEAPEKEASGDPLQEAYALLVRSTKSLVSDGREAVRDSDVKRKMLALDRSFDEAELGFGKFNRFLRQAHDHEVIDLRKRESGNYEVALRDGPETDRGRTASEGEAGTRADPGGADRSAPSEIAIPTSDVATDTGIVSPTPEERGVDPERSSGGAWLGPRRGSTRRRGPSESPPPLFEGQAVVTPERTTAAAEVHSGSSEIDLAALGLPTGHDAALRYLTNSYRGVGAKTAEALVDRFGDRLFHILHQESDELFEVLSKSRAEAVLGAWREDFRRRSQTDDPPNDSDGHTKSGGRGSHRTRRGRG